VCILELFLQEPPNYGHPLDAMWISATKGLKQYIPDALSDDGKDFFAKCLIKNPDKRASAENLLEVYLLSLGSNSSASVGK
jgi:hypothetical protein